MVLIGGIFLFCLLPSFIISKLSFRQWYAQICMCGVRKLAYSMSKLGRSDPQQVLWYEPAFAFYWSVTIKYFIPSVLWFLLVGNTKADIDKPYGGYASHWQTIGLIVPLLGLIAFFINICFWLHDEQLDMADFQERFHPDFVDPWDEGEGSLKSPGMNEMKQLNQVAAEGGKAVEGN